MTKPGDFLIKVCGVTNLDDVRLSIDGGANAIGLNFYPPSPRCISRETAQTLIGAIPEQVLVVAVWVLREGTPEQSRDDLKSLEGILNGRPGAIQVHGARSEADLPDCEARLMVATSPEQAPAFPRHDVIIDTSWGTGQRGDWEAIRRLQRSFILSGGLTSENVVLAMELLRPAGVDVCSGVETVPGRKDPDRLKTFLERARQFAILRKRWEGNHENPA